MNSRADERASSAAYLNSLDRQRLLAAFGISRVAEITGFDRVGLPVWKATRPGGSTITISAGKSLDRDHSRAGAIAEAIELNCAENPPEEQRVISSYIRWGEVGLGYPFFSLPLCRFSLCGPATEIAWEVVKHVLSESETFVPADLVWCCQVHRTKFRLFMMGSNGLSFGYNKKDALFQGVLELIERDAIALWKFKAQKKKLYPLPCHLECNSQTALGATLALCRARNIEPVFFELTIDSRIPVIHSILYDPAIGTFAGYGCHLSTEVAATRALQEAIQARAVYISGERDDIMRRIFSLARNLAWDFGDVPTREPLSIQVPPSLDAQWDLLFRVLPAHLAEHLYYKVFYEDEHCCCLRVLSLDLDTWPWEDWQPRARALEFLEL